MRSTAERKDYDERTSLLGLGEGMLILEMLVAAASPALVAGVFGLGSDAPPSVRSSGSLPWSVAAGDPHASHPVRSVPYV